MKLLSLKTLAVPVFSFSMMLQACGPSKNENSQTKGLGIADIIEGFVKLAEKAAENAKNSADASAFIEGVSGDLYHKINIEASKKRIRPYNVAMCDGSNSCSLQAKEGVNYYLATVKFKDRPYMVWAFRAGVFTNNGNNGWDQWRVLGCHDLESGKGIKVVNFKNTGWIGPVADAKIGCI